MRDSSGSNVAFVTLTAGFLALVVAIASAYRAPATGYEVSIYRSTPLVFWGGTTLAVVATVVATIASESDRGAFVLGYLTALAVIGLPILRGYRYFGRADSLTHLGWMKDIRSGVVESSDLLYPGMHTTSLHAESVMGIDLTHAGLVVVFVFAALYLLAFPVCLARVTDAPPARLAGLLAAFVWLPVNNISVHMMPHSISIAILFFPFVLLLVLIYVKAAPSRSRLPSSRGILLFGSVVAMLFIHPQAMVILIAVFGVISAFQFVQRRRASDPVVGHRPMYLQTGLATAAFLLWIPRFERAHNTVLLTVYRLVSPRVVGGETAQRGDSLADLGGSIIELFLKLFLPSVVFIVLASAIVASIALFAIGQDDLVVFTPAVAVQYVVVMFVPVAGMFMVMVMASVTTLHFRFLGFLMVVIGTLGTVAILDIGRWIGTTSPRLATAGVLLVLVLMVPLGTATLYGSPYIYQGNAQVTATELNGHETAFAHADTDVVYTGIRAGPHRYVDAAYGTEAPDRVAFEEGVEGEVFNRNLTAHYDEPRYFSVTTADYQREVALYGELRYSQDGFVTLNQSPQIHRVQSNGGHDVYLITPDDT